MFIARWQLKTRFGRTEEALAVLRKWEVDVGTRIGWRPGSIRVATGVVGTAQTDIELETRVDTLADLESAWRDMEQLEPHLEHLKKLEPLLVSGGSSWVILRQIELTFTD